MVIMLNIIIIHHVSRRNDITLKMVVLMQIDMMILMTSRRVVVNGLIQGVTLFEKLFLLYIDHFSQ